MLLLLAALASAQTPSDAWRTTETLHFRVHYPAQAEPFALDLVSQLESVRERVEAEVGWEMDRVVDLVVEDPYAMANGMALPVRGRPKMVVWTTPPGADSVIGNYRSWVEDLVVHEDTHLVHMVRPSRNRLVRPFYDHLLGVGPVVTKSPLWLMEGYATHLEGKLTGHGRPNADFRAALLRRWALEGRLPAYGDLDGTGQWMGGGVPYLVGSAFVDWLVDQHGEQSLRDLWARMSARKLRGFGSSFEGVYGQQPDELYAGFSAWLTHAALEVELERGADEHTLWMDLYGSTGQPVVSPDGSQVALVVDDELGPALLEVYSTADDPEPLQEHQERGRELVERDPLDVPARPPEVFEREAESTRLRSLLTPVEPRWMPSGEAMLFTAWTRRPSGGYGPDLYTWALESGAQQRLTRGADLRSADPHPDGTWAVAVRQRWGQSELVRVSLDTGEITTLDGPHLHTLHDHPRLSPDGSSMAYLRHQGGWELVVRSVADGSERVLALPEGGQVATPEWAPDGESVLAVVGLAGFLEVWRIPLAGEPVQLTRTAGAALAPAPTPDGEALFHLVLDSDGLDLHRLRLDSALGAAELSARPATPAVRRPYVEVPPLDKAAVPESRPYGLGRVEWRPIFGGSGASWGGSTELGLRLGDTVGRHEIIALGAWGGGMAPRGGSLSFTWRRLPVDLQLMGYGIQERGATHVGGVLQASDEVRFSRGTVRGLAGVLHDLDPTDASVKPWTTGFAGVQTAAWGQASVLWAEVDLEGRAMTGADSHLLHGRAELDLGLMGSWLALELGRTASGGQGGPGLVVGGLDHSIVPEPWLWTRALTPMSAPVLPADDLRTLGVSWWLSPIFSLDWERYRWDEGTELRSLAMALHLDLDSQPLVRLPGVSLEAGVGLMLVDPYLGVLSKPARDVDNYTTWTTVVWRP